MKRKLLLFSLLVGVISTDAQERKFEISNTPQESFNDLKVIKNAVRGELTSHQYQQKTTSAPRWYSYADYYDTSSVDDGTGAAASTNYMWKDTMAVMAYSDVGGGTLWQHNRMVSVGLVTDPAFSGFNNSGYYAGQMSVGTTDAYSVDSIRFFGIYGFNPANTSVDTIRVRFVYGNAGYGNGITGPDVYLAKTGNPVVLANYGVSAPDSMSTHRMHFDTNVVGTNGTTVLVKDIILDNTGTSPAWGDTLSDGTYYGRVGFPDVNIPAGNLIGATLTFINGDPGFMPHDTVFGTSIGYKYNMFRPYSIFKGSNSTSGPAPVYAYYDVNNRNSGMYKTLPDTAKGWGGQYIPLWFWSSGSGASTLQYPYIDFHVKCATCGIVVNEVRDIHLKVTATAYPNPAAGELNIPFTLSGSSDVTVTILNILGQEVARQEFRNVSKGMAIFNTNKLAGGVYTYVLVANGKKVTGRVAILD